MDSKEPLFSSRTMSTKDAGKLISITIVTQGIDVPTWIASIMSV